MTDPLRAVELAEAFGIHDAVKDLKANWPTLRAAERAEITEVLAAGIAKRRALLPGLIAELQHSTVVEICAFANPAAGEENAEAAARAITGYQIGPAAEADPTSDPRFAGRTNDAMAISNDLSTLRQKCGELGMIDLAAMELLNPDSPTTAECAETTLATAIAQLQADLGGEIAELEHAVVAAICAFANPTAGAETAELAARAITGHQAGPAVEAGPTPDRFGRTDEAMAISDGLRHFRQSCRQLGMIEKAVGQ